MAEHFSKRALLSALGTGRLGLVGLAAGVAMGAASPAWAVDIIWDDAGGSASKSWGDAGNWSPDSPSLTAGDEIFVGVTAALLNYAPAANDSTLLDKRYNVNSLFIGNGADVTNSSNSGTNAFELQVDFATTVGNGTGTSILTLFDPDVAGQEGLDTNTLTVNSGGQIILNSLNSSVAGDIVKLQVDNGLFDINAGGDVRGNGIIELADVLASPTVLLSNDGTITATSTGLVIIGPSGPPSTTLQINATDPNARFDWDGASGTGVLSVGSNATMDINIAPGSAVGGDPFGGTINLATGSTFDVAAGWSLGGGTINANTPSFLFVLPGNDPSPGPGATISGAAWTLATGTVNVDDTWDTLILDSDVNATGGAWNITGKLQVDGNATFGAGTSLNGLGSAAQLVVNGSATINQDPWNWDGFSVTTVNDGATLTINSSAIDTAADGFDATLNINGGTVNVTNAWAFEIATLNLDTSNSDSDLSGGTITFNTASATINVIGTGIADADINAEIVVDAAIDVNIAPGTTLDLGINTINATGTTWDGGAGSVLRNGVATINAITTYNLPGGSIDLDDGNDTLNAQLNINADAIDTASPASDGYDGVLTINNSGALIVNLTGNETWLFEGTLDYNGDATSGTVIGGNSPVRFTSASTVNITGEGALTTRAIFEGTVNINSAAEDLELFGGTTVAGNTNEINGGTINGPGQLAIDAGQALRGNGIINAPVRGDGTTSQLIAEDGLLDVNGTLVSMGVLGTSGAAAVLDIGPFSTSVTNAVLLQDGRIQGGTITNDGANGIKGFGEVISRVINNTILEANSGGELLFNNTLSDWDGAGNAGELRATGAGSVLRLDDSATFLFSGTVTAQAGGTVFADTFELEFEPGSTLNLLSGGTYRSTNATDIGGTVVVSGVPSTMNISGTTVFENGSNTTLNGDLLLDNTVTNIEPGATFTGAGRLFNEVGRTTRLLNNADVGVLLQNRGDLELGTGASAARGDVTDYVQASTGSTNVDLNGTGIGQFDRLFASGNAQLQGNIDLSVGFTPALLDSFTVLNATAGLIGTFDTVSGVNYAPGRALAVTYSANSVIVTATRPGDVDLDGDVDDADLGTMFAGYGGPGVGGNGWADGDLDGDGDVDDADLGTGFANYTGPLSPAAVPEPASAALLALGGLALARRRRSA